MSQRLPECGYWKSYRQVIMPNDLVMSMKTLHDLEQRKQPSTIQALQEIARWAKDNRISAPADLSENHNEYAWGE